MPSPETESIWRERNDAASVWMKRGIALLNEPSPERLKAAIGCFDQAIEIRKSLPLEVQPWFAYGLSAGWLNRGDAFRQLASAPDLEEAIRSFDEGIALLHKLPLDENPLYRKRSVIARLNRGLCLHAQRTDRGLNEALRSFEECVSLLQPTPAFQIPEHRQLLAAAWTNRGNVLLDFAKPDALEARRAAHQALETLAQRETQEPTLAEIALKARHILCRAIAHLLADSESPMTAADLIQEATDAVEGGLALTRNPDSFVHPELSGLQDDLFRFGARIYQKYQPHFLTEFLLEHLEPKRDPDSVVSAQTHRAILETLWRATAELQREGFAKLNTPRFERLLRDLADLRVVEEKLNQLRAAQFRS